MRAALARRSGAAFVIAMLAVVVSGCVVPGGYVGGGYGIGYYQPAGIAYGGWAQGYQAAPFRAGNYHPPAPPRGHAPPHAYKSAPPSRNVPSIPSGSPPAGHGHR